MPGTAKFEHKVTDGELKIHFPALVHLPRTHTQWSAILLQQQRAYHHPKVVHAVETVIRKTQLQTISLRVMSIM